MAEWKVNDCATLSDHQLITFKVQLEDTTTPAPNETSRGWKWPPKVHDKFKELLKARLAGVQNCNPQSVTAAIVGACNDGLRRITLGKRRPVNWWCEEVEVLKKATIKTKRQLTRARRREPHTAKEKFDRYKTARKNLTKGIKAAKARALNKLVDEVEDNP